MPEAETATRGRSGWRARRAPRPCAPARGRAPLARGSPVADL